MVDLSGWLEYVMAWTSVEENRLWRPKSHERLIFVT